MAAKPTRRISADEPVAIHNPRAIAGRIQSSIRAYVPLFAATIAAARYSRPATTITWSNTTFQTRIAQMIQRPRAMLRTFAILLIIAPASGFELQAWPGAWGLEPGAIENILN